MTNTILFAILVMFVVTLILVALLLWIKSALTPSGSVKVSINGGSKELEVTPGGDLMHTLADHGIFLPSACGGKANCGQCKLQVLEGGGTILPTETGFFSRKQIKDGWRLGCQVKVKDNLQIAVPESALSVKKLECEGISNQNVAGVVSKFTSVLGEAKYNIASMINQNKQNLAYNLIDVDGRVDEATIEKLSKIEGVISVRPIYR